MDRVEMLRTQAQMAFDEVVEALDGVTEHQSWAVLPNLGPDYLHSDASIHGITLHVATGKYIYGSVAFRDSALRWRDMAAQIGEFEPSWPAARAYLDRAHAYWMESWANLSDLELDQDVPRFTGQLWPAWKIIRMVTHHDSYHAGQIAMIRYGVGPSDMPPPSTADDIRKYCAELPSW